MPIVYDGEYIEQVTEIAKADMTSIIEGVQSALGTDAVGMATPSAQELASFFFHQQVLYPPQTFTYPDGHIVTGSPWILALEFCDNGTEWLSRFTRFVARNSGGI